MTGRSRLPGGEPRKASQRNSRRAEAPARRIARAWKPGDRVQWQARTGVFRRHVGDEVHAEVTSDGRVYRVRVADLR